MTKILMLILTFLPFTILHAQGHNNKDVLLAVKNIDRQNGNVNIRLSLKFSKNNEPVTMAQLKEIHTQKFHLLVADNTLEDYVHIHPKANGVEGEYEFSFKPKKETSYRMWADIFPISLNQQIYIMADLIKGTEAKVNKKTSMSAKYKNLNFALSFDNERIKQGEAVMGQIMVTDSSGQPFKDLEPIMGAYAHIVGFYDDFQTITHIHPMGAEPNNPKDRGGPQLQFHIEPQKAGFIKIYAQMRINGEEVYIPFGVIVDSNLG